jgi:hypothetical protein
MNIGGQDLRELRYNQGIAEIDKIFESNMLMSILRYKYQINIK